MALVFPRFTIAFDAEKSSGSKIIHIIEREREKERSLQKIDKISLTTVGHCQAVVG